VKIAPDTSQGRGVAHVPSVLVHPQLNIIASAIDSFYQGLDQADLHERTAFVDQVRALGEKFVPTASSVTIGAVLSDANAHGLLRSVVSSCAGKWLKETLGHTVAVDLDQSWVRRQYAPGRYPPLHAPHQWHQDGALGFNFLSVPPEARSAQGLLEIITIWIALGPCGLDAPGLELVLQPIQELVRPELLADGHLRTAFAPELFWTPALATGDALLFSGDILHRTHVTSGMSRDRTSIELRCFAAERLPSRLKGDRFVLLPRGAEDL